MTSLQENGHYASTLKPSIDESEQQAAVVMSSVPCVPPTTGEKVTLYELYTALNVMSIFRLIKAVDTCI